MTTLSVLVDKFTEYLTSSGKSSLTIVAYKNDLRQLLEFLSKLGKTTPETVSTEDLEAFKKDLVEKNYTAKSVARKLNAVKGLFRWAVQEKEIVQDPAGAVAHPKYELSPPRVLSPLEYRALRDAARDDLRIAAIVDLLLQTGMRISEVAALKVKNITQASVNVGEREIPLSPAAKRATDQYLQVRPKINSEHLFITKTGRSLLVRNIRAAIERCFAEAGIEDATVNDIRNTFIVHQLSAGVDLLKISSIVGHKRLATTERYLEFVKQKENLKGRAANLKEL